MANKKTLIRVAAAVLIVGGGAAIYAWLHRGQETTDDAAFEATVVTVSPRVAGYVKDLPIADNQQVHAGDVLLEIDPADYEFRLAHAEAALDAAAANLAAARQNLETTKVSAPSGEVGAQAQVTSAIATWEDADKKLKRLQSLSDAARSRQQLDDAIAGERAAASNLSDARARLRSAETAPEAVAAAAATVDQLEAVVRQATADVKQAKKDLNDTKVLSPIDGRVTNRGVERGNYVQPGQELLSLVGNDVWVVANFKETQLTDMRPGQKAEIRVDAFPDAKIMGTVDSIQAGTGSRFSAFPAQNATGNFVKIVQRVPVKIMLDKNSGPLSVGPGMSVVPTVYIQ